MLIIIRQSTCFPVCQTQQQKIGLTWLFDKMVKRIRVLKNPIIKDATLPTTNQGEFNVQENQPKVFSMMTFCNLILIVKTRLHETFQKDKQAFTAFIKWSALTKRKKAFEWNQTWMGINQKVNNNQWPSSLIWLQTDYHKRKCSCNNFKVFQF